MKMNEAQRRIQALLKLVDLHPSPSDASVILYLKWAYLVAGDNGADHIPRAWVEDIKEEEDA